VTFDGQNGFFVFRRLLVENSQHGIETTRVGVPLWFNCSRACIAKPTSEPVAMIINFGARFASFRFGFG
jgi:hypothetical protein